MKYSNTLSYIRSFVSDPDVASLTPTSTFGVEALLGSIDFKRCSLFVEYGPGGGVITSALLSRMTPESKLVAIEKNERFAKGLIESNEDSRLIVLNESAAQVDSLLESLFTEGRIPKQNPDHILSGIPFSMFSCELKREILSKTRDALAKNGSFLIYQFLISLSLGKNDIHALLPDYFNIIRKEMVFRNVPPLRIFEVTPT